MVATLQDIPTTRPQTPLLDSLQGVDDLRQLETQQLPLLAQELRQYLLFCVGQTGGHLGAGLGVVELTIVLHYLLNTPYDRLIWDVGHQAYPHKILTGRKDAMLSMRQAGGLSPFPKREESPFDCFGVGHASTSISALLGMALIDGEQLQHVAVVGDGALTGGMAFEALNHMAQSQANGLVIVNDNDMSINANQGGLAKFLDETGSEGGPRSWFTALGFTYVGPIDGHDISSLIKHIQDLLLLPGPKLLHIHTVKGRGYLAAEQDPVGYHAIDKIDPIAKAPSPKAATYANIFGQWACHVAAQDSRLQVITPAMVGGSGLSAFASQFPKQLHDVAIAEQHAVTLAAGMACAGAKPVVAIYSTFLQRGYDQLVHDVALQNLDVLFAVDRAGVVGEDGATHTGAYDISYLACVPNLVLMAPSSAQEAISLLQLGYEHNGPAVVRYPRGVATEGLPVVDINMGESHLLRKGSKVAILNFGALLPAAAEVAASLDATLVDMRFIKPLDSNRLEQLLDHNIWVTLEDHAITGGAGGLVAQWLAQQAPAKCPKLINLGLPDKVLAHATREQVLAESGLTATDIEKTIQAALAV
ncbi:MAG TPA: 1-deoxy-D-xylulose-5-phosphate synthase [Oceanospirillaceae bacterium]|nr:1-deoxy-D-xylulose-5-phosphate synthase [Oceanospirillaceae bacterium]|tara:strand:- start:2664 stop:4424 length:1761 start_codon:yes stop_codon:yes gene_type:complete